MGDQPILKWFRYSHLPRELAKVSKPFCDLAFAVARDRKPGPETSVTLRKLLEAKDAAVRAYMEEEGL